MDACTETETRTETDEILALDTDELSSEENL